VALWRSDKEAWRELAPLWQVTLPDGDACAAAARQQLQCFRGSGGLGLIRQLGRPGILTLQDEAGRPAYALLTGLTQQGAVLRMAGGSRTVPLTQLVSLWRGDFATFWRAPEGYSSKLGPGESSPAVDWLANRLAALQHQPAPPPGTPFDAALKQRLQAFQLAQGLKPDGRPGPVTFMQLNRAADVAEPRLPAEL
jgi:general secretion pathway protein A